MRIKLSLKIVILNNYKCIFAFLFISWYIIRKSKGENILNSSWIDDKRSFFYLHKLIDNMWNYEIKIITGIRRCGKSVLLFELVHQYLLDNGVNDEQIIKIELD